jgi:hypothetical protein
MNTEGTWGGGEEPLTGVDEPPLLDDDGPSSSDNYSSLEDDAHDMSDDDVDEDDPNGDDYELAGALHEFYHALQVVSNLNDISAFPVATRKMQANKAKAEQGEDRTTSPEDTSVMDFLNYPNDDTSLEQQTNGIG